MLDGDHYRTAQLVDQLMSNAQMKMTFDLIECLKPKLYIENGVYHYQYVDAHIDVIGNTLHEAMMNFQSAYFNQKPI